MSSGKVSFETLKQYFSLPITAAAQELGVCATMLKKLCRQYGVKRWPHRKIQSIDDRIRTLERALAKPGQTAESKQTRRHELAILRQKRETIINNPNAPVSVSERDIFEPVSASTTPGSESEEEGGGGEGPSAASVMDEDAAVVDAAGPSSAASTAAETLAAMAATAAAAEEESTGGPPAMSTRSKTMQKRRGRPPKKKQEQQLATFEEEEEDFESLAAKQLPTLQPLTQLLDAPAEELRKAAPPMRIVFQQQQQQQQTSTEP